MIDNDKNKHTTSQQEQSVIYNQQNLGIGAAFGQRPNRLETRTTIDKRDTHALEKQVEEKVYQLERKSADVLFRTQTVFPFDFFPDTLTISANKIDIVSSNFFLSHQTTSIPLRDIANVQVQTVPFFATLRIVNIRNSLQPSVLRYLKKRDAIKAKNIIDGLLVAMSQGADIAAIEPHLLLKQIETVGKSSVEE